MTKRDKLGLSFLTRWTKFLAEKRPDFIHSFLSIPNLYARLAKLFGRVRTVITSERNIEVAHRPVWFLLERSLWRLSDRIIANAWGVKEVLTSRVAIPADHITVIHNGVAADRFCHPRPERVAQLRAMSGASQENSLLIGLIGRLQKQKNHLGLLQAVARLRGEESFSTIRLGFWGSEPDPAYAVKVRSTIAASGLEPYVTLFKPEEDMASVYAACDIVVLPSLWEGFPNVVLEAMAAGKLIVASDIVDNTHIIDDGENGFLLRAGDVEHLAQVLAKAISLPAHTRRNMELKAAETAGTSFSVQKMVQSTMNVYRELGLC